MALLFSGTVQELNLIAQKYNAPVICLQETNLKDDQMTLKGYVAYHKSGTIDDMDRAHGGVLIFIKSNLPQSFVDVTLPLEAIVVKVILHTTITFCNFYIPPSTALHLCDLANIEDQLPKPFVIVWDFNSHNYSWGGNKNDANRRFTERFMTKSNICLFNDDTPCIQQLVLLHQYISLCAPHHFPWILHGGWRKIIMAVTIFLSSFILQTTDYQSGSFTKLIGIFLKTCVWRPFLKTILMEVSSWKHLSTSFVKLPTKQSQN